MILRSGTLRGVTSMVHSVRAALDLLSVAPVPPEAGLSFHFDLLSDALVAAVPSFLGFTAQAEQFSLSWGPGMPTQPGGVLPAASTLRWQLTSDLPVPLTLVMYAAIAGAWVDLSADLAWLTCGPPQSFIIDRDLPAVMSADFTALTDASIVNQATGALIERGLPPDEATAYLIDTARNEDTDLTTAAATFLATFSP